MQGFSSANLWRMRNFYIAYQKNEKLAPMVREKPVPAGQTPKLTFYKMIKHTP